MAFGTLEQEILRPPIDGDNHQPAFWRSRTFDTLQGQENAETLQEQALRLADATYNGIEKYTNPDTGLAPDRFEPRKERVAYQTSPTNIGLQLSDAICALELNLERPEVVFKKLLTLSRTLLQMDRVNGMFDNWYDIRDGKRLDFWPDGNGEFMPYKLSSVDNAWLATGLITVISALESEAETNPDAGEAVENCKQLLSEMDFSIFLRPGDKVFRMCYYPSEDEWVRAKSGEKITPNPEQTSLEQYMMLHSETRLVFWVALALGQIDWEYYFSMWRTPPDIGINLSQRPQGSSNNYEGIEVENTYFEKYGIQYLPANVGAAFETLAVPLFVPETELAKSWGEQIQSIIKLMMMKTMGDMRLWGISTGDAPQGYAEQGNEDICVWKDFSTPQLIINPSASAMALPFAPDPSEVMANLAKIEGIAGMYSPEHGFAGSLVVAPGYRGHSLTTALPDHLILDKSWTLAALTAFLNDGLLAKLFAKYMFKNNPDAEKAFEVYKQETFFSSQS